MYHQHYMMRTFPGLSPLSTVKLGEPGKRRIMGIFPYVASDGTIYFIICCPSRIYYYKPGDAVPTGITGSLTLTGGETNYFDAVYWTDTDGTYDPWIIIANGVDAPFYWDGTGNCSLLGGSPSVSLYISSFAGHIILSHVKSGATYYNQRDQWSNIDNAEDWSAGTAGSNDLRQDAGGIMGDLVFGDLRFVFKELSTTLCRPTSSIPPFNYAQEFLPIGCAAPRTIIKIWRHDLGFFLGNDLNCYIVRKDGSYVPVGDDITYRLRDWNNDAIIQYSFAFYYPALDYLIFGVPSSNDSSNYCDYLFGFDLGHYVKTGEVVWTPPIITGLNLSAASQGKFKAAYTIGELGPLGPTIGEFDPAITIGELFEAGAFSTMIVGDKDGLLWQLEEGHERFGALEITGSETVTNGEFTTDTTGWYPGNAAVLSSVAGGQAGNCLKVQADGTDDPFAYQTISVIEGQLYLATVYVKQGDEATYHFQVRDVTHSQDIQILANREATSSWVKQEMLFEVPNGCTQIYIGLYCVTTAGSAKYMLFDTVSMKQVSLMGDKISWELETPDYKLADDFANNARLVEYILMYRKDGGNNVDVQVSTDGGAEYSDPYTVTLSGSGADDEELDVTAWIDKFGRKHRFKISGTGIETIIGQQMFAKPVGRR